MKKLLFPLIAGLTVVVIVLLAVAIRQKRVFATRPEACRSCHIMEESYDKWREGAHAHLQKDDCLKCHTHPSHSSVTLHAARK